MRSWRIVQRGNGSTLVLGFLIGAQLDAKLRELYPGACIAACLEGDPSISDEEIRQAYLSVGARRDADVHLIAWSAGCQAVRTIEASNMIEPDRVKLVMCLDGTAANFPQIQPAILQTWRKLFQRAREGKVRAIFTCTSMGYVEHLPVAAGKQGPYMSTRHVLERVLSDEDTPIGLASPADFAAAQKDGKAVSLEVGVPVADGGLYVERYASEEIDGPAHVRQVELVMPALLRALKDAPMHPEGESSLSAIFSAIQETIRKGIEMLGPDARASDWFRQAHTDADKLVQWCENEMSKGVKEDHPGTKRSARIDEYFTGPQYVRNGQALHLLGVNWCAAAQSACNYECGHPEVPAFVSGIEFETWAKANSRWADKATAPKKGWLAIFLRGSGPAAWERHVTRVMADAAQDGAYRTIGGNEAGGAWGQDDRPAGATDATLSGFVMV